MDRETAGGDLAEQMSGVGRQSGVRVVIGKKADRHWYGPARERKKR